MSEPRSTLDRAAASAGQSIRIEDRGPVGQVTLRGDLGSDTLRAAVRAGVGVDVPGPLRAAFDGDRGAVWMSPDELLLFVAYDRAGALAASLGAALAGAHHLAVDVSDARAVIRLSGSGVAEVLAKGAPVDLGPAAFPAGTARRSHVGGVAVGFWRRGENEWEIVCLASFARHLFDWLVESSREGSEVGAF
ncbi:MAG: sarcosine oxidase subunit gamma [Proteobacteria bacterium]|nr:sarcosine oxidase subunit gamma [Pseudomonadota bacterium]MCH8951410.1 sarcosine oxidase subunit gamma [Pseudomonadota bacterium]